MSPMTAAKDLVTGEVKVEYIFTHSCHRPCRAELRFLPLSQSLGKEVKEKIAQGITIEKIMDGKFMSVTYNHLIIMLYLHMYFWYQSWSWKMHSSDDLQQHNWAEPLCDMSRSLEHHQSKERLQSSQTCEDAITMGGIVKHLLKEEPSPILAYKQQGLKHPSYLSLPDESFLFIIMTGFQSKLFYEYASIYRLHWCYTYRTNKYKFRLSTLLVVDEYRKCTHGGGNNDYYRCYICEL